MNRSSLVTGEHSGLGNMDPTDDGTHNDPREPQPKQDLGLERSNPNLIAAAGQRGVRLSGLQPQRRQSVGRESAPPAACPTP